MSTAPVFVHLESLAADMAARPDAERVRFIYAERWIGFPRAELGLSLLRDLIQHPPCARMPCLLIHGDSGMGKTKIVERFRRDFPDDFDTEQGCARRPVVVMELPPGPGEQRFYGQLLATLNAPHHGYERLDVLEQIALRLLRAINPRMLIIDEVHNLLAGTPREQRRTLNLLKFLANQLRVPLVCLGTDDALRAMQSDPQIASRFEPFHLPRWCADAAFRSLLATLEAALPLRKPSNLGQKAMVEYILTHSGGITGNVVRLLTRAAVYAILDGQERMDAAVLERGLRPPPIERKQPVLWRGLPMTRRIPLSHGAHLTGWHPVRPGHGAVPFESALERDTITWLSQWPGFCRLVAQPVTIEYLHPDGRLAHYTPDLFVVFDPLPGALRTLGFGPETYIEVKGAAEAERLAERLSRLRAAVEHECRRPWVLLTEREVRSTGRPRFRWSPPP